MKIMLSKQLHDLLFLDQIPGSCMRQASFVLDMKMAVSNPTSMERKSSLSENGDTCVGLSVLL